MKRIIDIVLSLLLIALLSPILIIIYLSIRITSRGAAIYADARLGRDGRDIKVYKFRTMFSDAEENISKYLTEEQIEQWKKERKLDSDPRITKVGNILRKTSLDELPQLFNILKGDMSFIGPRPITRQELENNYTQEEQKLFVSCKPGLTGMWGAYGRSNCSYESGLRQKLELDYVRNRSIKLDLKIFFHTFVSVIKREGAK